MIIMIEYPASYYYDCRTCIIW